MSKVMRTAIMAASILGVGLAARPGGISGKSRSDGARSNNSPGSFPPAGP
jgi:hypothetical protein